MLTTGGWEINCLKFCITGETTITTTKDINLFEWSFIHKESMREKCYKLFPFDETC